MRAVWLSSTYYLDDAIQTLSANAERMFTRAMAHCGNAESQGYVSESAIKMLGLPNPRKLIAELVDARILVPRTSGGWDFRSWESWNSAGDALIARRKADRDRQARRRAAERNPSRDMSRDTTDGSDAENHGYSPVADGKTGEKSTSTNDPQPCAQPVETASDLREPETMSRDMSRDVTAPEESRGEKDLTHLEYEHSRNVGGDERGLSEPVSPSASRLVAALIPETIPAKVRAALRIHLSQLMNRDGDGVDSDIAAEVLRRWLNTPGAGVGLLPHIAAEIIRERAAPEGGKPANKLRAIAELAARERARERARENAQAATGPKELE